MISVYNVVTYDGVDSYVIKAIGRDEKEIKEQMTPYGDMEVLKIEKQYDWNDLNEHIKLVIAGQCEMAGGNSDIQLAIYRFIEHNTGLDLQ